MSSEDIPDDIRTFLLGSIDSIGEIEALMLLAADAREAWTAATLAVRLYVDESQAAAVLAKLAALNLATERDDGFRFQPRSAELADLTARALTLYRQKLVPITHLIHSKPDSLRDFSDAFKLKRDT